MPSRGKMERSLFFSLKSKWGFKIWHVETGETLSTGTGHNVKRLAYNSMLREFRRLENERGT